MKEIPIVALCPSSLREPKTNPNVMESDDFVRLTQAISRVGFLQPVLVRKMPDGTQEIVDGVHRARAARELGLATIPCVVLETQEAEARAIQVGMNRLRGELDLSRVAQSLSSLANEGWTIAQMTLTGFGEDEVAALLKATTSQNEEEIMAGAVEPSEDEGDTSEAAFSNVLEVEFTSRTELVAAKKKLRKIAGKGNPLGNAIIQLLEGTCE